MMLSRSIDPRYWTAPFLLTVLVCLVAAGGCGQRHPETTTDVAESSSVKVVGLVQFAREPACDLAVEGVLQALAEGGFREGENLRLVRQSAEGDFPTIQAIVQKLVRDQVDLIIPFSTPCLQTTAQVVREIPVVFTYVYDPFHAGVAQSPTDHPDNLTGVNTYPPVREMVELAREIWPQATRVGTVWNTSEANSEVAMTALRQAAQEMGFTLLEATVANASEVHMAAQSLAARDVEVITQIGDNTVIVGFDSLAGVCNENRIPLLTNDIDFVERGAIAGVGPDFFTAGRAAGEVAARVLHGEDPVGIPITSLEVDTIVLNQRAAALQGVSFPPALLERATKVLGP